MDPVVSPSVKTPGLYLKVNLLGGPPSGNTPLKALLIAPKSSAGSISDDTQVVQNVAGSDAVKGLLGVGTPGHLAAQAFFAAYPLGTLDVVAPAASGGASATGTFTFAGTPTSAMTFRISIKGYTIDTPWGVGQTAIQAATEAVARINAKTSFIPVTASNSGTAVVTLTPKIPGAWANDVLIAAKVIEGAGGTLTASGAALTGGTGEPDFANVLALVANQEYYLFLPCVSNADAQSSSASSNPGKLKTHIVSLQEGNEAKLQQAVVGLTGALAAAKTGAVSRNFGQMEYIFCMAGQSLGCEFAGYEAGRRMRVEQNSPVTNRIGEQIPDTLFGAADLVADKPTAIEVEDALHNGLSIVNYDANGKPFLVRPITTYSRDENAAFDDRIFGVEAVAGTYAFARDLRTQLPVEFKGAKVIKDLVEGEEKPPAGVAEERDIFAFVVTRADEFVRRGVLRRDKLNEYLANEEIIVEVNALDEEQVDIFIPVAIVKILSKFGVNVTRRA